MVQTIEMAERGQGQARYLWFSKQHTHRISSLLGCALHDDWGTTSQGEEELLTLDRGLDLDLDD